DQALAVVAAADLGRALEEREVGKLVGALRRALREDERLLLGALAPALAAVVDDVRLLAIAAASRSRDGRLRPYRRAALSGERLLRWRAGCARDRRRRLRRPGAPRPAHGEGLPALCQRGAQARPARGSQRRAVA